MSKTAVEVPMFDDDVWGNIGPTGQARILEVRDGLGLHSSASVERILRAAYQKYYSGTPQDTVEEWLPKHLQEMMKTGNLPFYMLHVRFN